MIQSVEDCLNPSHYLNTVNKLEEQIKLLFIMRNGQRIYCPNRVPLESWEPKTEVYIRNFPTHKSEEFLFAEFNQHGRILQTRLMMNTDGTNRGFAFVLYETPKQAAEAVKCSNMKVLRFANESKFLNVQLSFDNRSLLLSGIPKHLTKPEVFTHVNDRCPGLKKVSLYLDSDDTSKNRGYCFVEFESHNKAMFAKTDLSRYLVELWYCDDLVVKWAPPERQVDDRIMDKVKTIFVRGLHLKTSKRDLQRAVEDTLKVYLPFCFIRKHRDYAFISFHTREMALQAIQQLDGHYIGGAQVEVQLAKPPPNKPNWKICYGQRQGDPPRVSRSPQKYCYFPQQIQTEVDFNHADDKSVQNYLATNRVWGVNYFDQLKMNPELPPVTEPAAHWAPSGGYSLQPGQVNGLEIQHHFRNNYQILECQGFIKTTETS